MMISTRTVTATTLFLLIQKQFSLLLLLVLFLLDVSLVVDALSLSSQSSSSRNDNINNIIINININNINNIPVLYETDRILIVNKPFGIGHHTEQHLHGAATDDNNIATATTTNTTSSSSPGIVQSLRQQRSNNNNKQEDEEDERLYGVHRLDKVTSGILVLAKDSEMAATLSRKFSRGEIQKIYFGISAKKPKKKKQGWVMGEMVRSRRETWMLTTTSTKTKATTTSKEKNNKKNRNYAKTRFFTSSMNHHPNNNGNTNTGNINTTTNTNTVVFTEAYCYGPRTVIMFIPYTGKTHQLRVAAKSMGIPLMGDPLYEPKMISNVEHTTINENDDDRTSLTTTNNETIHQQQPQPQYPVHRTMLHATGIYIPSCDVVDTPITVWSDPPFFDDDNNNEKTLFHCQVEKLMTKHCPNQQLYEAMMMTVQQQQQ